MQFQEHFILQIVSVTSTLKKNLTVCMFYGADMTIYSVMTSYAQKVHHSQHLVKNDEDFSYLHWKAIKPLLPRYRNQLSTLLKSYCFTLSFQLLGLQGHLQQKSSRHFYTRQIQLRPMVFPSMVKKQHLFIPGRKEQEQQFRSTLNNYYVQVSNH